MTTRKKPKQLKVISGTDNGRTGSVVELKHSVNLVVPSWLNGMGKRKFKELSVAAERVRPLVESDGETLAMAACAYAHYRDAQKAVMLKPTVKGSQGQTMANPDVRRMNANQKVYQDCLTNLGLRPTDIAVSKTVSKGSPWSKK